MLNTITSSSYWCYFRRYHGWALCRSRSGGLPCEMSQLRGCADGWRVKTVRVMHNEKCGTFIRCSIMHRTFDVQWSMFNGEIYCTVMPVQQRVVLHSDACWTARHVAQWCMLKNEVFCTEIYVEQRNILHSDACSATSCVAQWCMLNRETYSTVMHVEQLDTLHNDVCSRTRCVAQRNILHSDACSVVRRAAHEEQPDELLSDVD
jgi:hypothetical protein